MICLIRAAKCFCFFRTHTDTDILRNVLVYYVAAGRRASTRSSLGSNRGSIYGDGFELRALAGIDTSGELDLEAIRTTESTEGGEGSPVGSGLDLRFAHVSAPMPPAPGGSQEVAAAKDKSKEVRSSSLGSEERLDVAEEVELDFIDGEVSTITHSQGDENAVAEHLFKVGGLNATEAEQEEMK